jgi:two-component system, OmpR family, response regulator
VATIALIEDERELVALVRDQLERAGHRVVVARDGPGGVALVEREEPDLIILDVMLPGFDGLEVCRRVRRTRITPILMLTARSTELDKVLGLELGADDYLTKPFSMRELLARVKALLRRSDLLQQERRDERGAVEAEAPLEVGPLRIDPVQHRASWSGRPLDLKPKEFDLLLFLARNRGAVVSRDLLLERVWGYDYPIDTRTIDVHVRWLREKVEAAPSNPVHLQTVRGRGYRFVV